MIVTADRVVTASEVHEPGWIEISGERIAAVGAGTAPGVPARELPGCTLVPGFVDTHVHGGGGGAFSTRAGALATRAGALAARAAHLAHGTTTTMASLVAEPPAVLLEQVALLAGLVGEGLARGIHLEGPWLSRARAGAHDPSLLRDPDPAEIDGLLEAADGALAMVTLAPELPGGLDAIRRFVAAGVVVAVGHTDATYDETRAAIDAGATVATHLFNAMRPPHHREPGPALALLEDPRVAVELIADGVHLHPALFAALAARAGARASLVTDAMAAACCADGAYRLGGLDVSVADGVARVAGTETIAGSTATMDQLFRAAALASGDGADAAPGRTALIDAVRMTAANPARAMGWDDAGDLAPGRSADAVVLDPELRVREVIRRGSPVGP